MSNLYYDIGHCLRSIRGKSDFGSVRFKCHNLELSIFHCGRYAKFL